MDPSDSNQTEQPVPGTILVGDPNDPDRNPDQARALERVVNYRADTTWEERAAIQHNLYVNFPEDISTVRDFILRDLFWIESRAKNGTLTDDDRKNLAERYRQMPSYQRQERQRLIRDWISILSLADGVKRPPTALPRPRPAPDAPLGCKGNCPESSQVSRILGKLNRYPEILDLRTGRPIPFPSGVRGVVPENARVAWGARERGEFIAEWYKRGYPTPPGGWEEYDIHHILPREYGGGNDFWNLTPVLRRTHQELFNSFWGKFSGL